MIYLKKIKLKQLLMNNLKIEIYLQYLIYQFINIKIN